MGNLDEYTEILFAVHEPLMKLCSQIPQPEKYIDADHWQSALLIFIEKIEHLIFYHLCRPEGDDLRPFAGAVKSPKRQRLESIVKLSRKLYQEVSAARQDRICVMELALYEKYRPCQDINPKHFFDYINCLPDFADKLEAFLVEDKPTRGRPRNKQLQRFVDDLAVLFIHFLKERPPKTKPSDTSPRKTLFYKIIEISLNGFPGVYVTTAVVDKLVMGLTLPPDGVEKLHYKVVYAQMQTCPIPMPSSMPFPF